MDNINTTNERQPKTVLYVGGLPTCIKVRELDEMFGKYGEILEMKIYNGLYSKAIGDDNNNALAFITYASMYACVSLYLSMYV